MGGVRSFRTSLKLSLAIADLFMASILLISPDDVMAETGEGYCHERPDRSPGSVVVLDPTAVGDHEGSCYFRDNPSGSSSSCEQLRMVCLTSTA